MHKKSWQTKMQPKYLQLNEFSIFEGTSTPYSAFGKGSSSMDISITITISIICSVCTLIISNTNIALLKSLSWLMKEYQRMTTNSRFKVHRVQRHSCCSNHPQNGRPGISGWPSTSRWMMIQVRLSLTQLIQSLITCPNIMKTRVQTSGEASMQP